MITILINHQIEKSIINFITIILIAKIVVAWFQDLEIYKSRDLEIYKSRDQQQCSFLLRYSPGHRKYSVSIRFWSLFWTNHEYGSFVVTTVWSWIVWIWSSSLLICTTHPNVWYFFHSWLHFYHQVLVIQLQFFKYVK